MTAVRVGPDYLRLDNRVQVFGVVCEACRDSVEVGWCESPNHPTFDSWASVIKGGVKKTTPTKVDYTPDLNHAQVCPKCEKYFNATTCPYDGVRTLTPKERERRVREANKARDKRAKRGVR